MTLMAKKTPPRTFNDVIALLGGQRFDVAPAQEGSRRIANAVQVRKYGCAGYQKFLKTSKFEIPATADHLRALHEFTEELNDAIGATILYNQALGTTSDVYNYDRVQGRE
jgi:hypothetical protein